MSLCTYFIVVGGAARQNVVIPTWWLVCTTVYCVFLWCSFRCILILPHWMQHEIACGKDRPIVHIGAAVQGAGLGAVNYQGDKDTNCLKWNSFAGVGYANPTNAFADFHLRTTDLPMSLFVVSALKNFKNQCLPTCPVFNAFGPLDESEIAQMNDVGSCLPTMDLTLYQLLPPVAWSAEAQKHVCNSWCFTHCKQLFRPGFVTNSFHTEIYTGCHDRIAKRLAVGAFVCTYWWDYVVGSM